MGALSAVVSKQRRPLGDDDEGVSSGVVEQLGAAPAVVITAAGGNGTVPDGVFRRWIAKPFTHRALREEISEVLAWNGR